MTEIETVMIMLERRGYVVIHLRQPTDSEAGVVAFMKPESLTAGWNQPRVAGVVTLSRSEVDRLKDLHAGRDYLFERVNLAQEAFEAEARKVMGL